MKLILLSILINVILNMALAQTETERRYTKINKVHSYFTPLGVANLPEGVDVMPGNDSYGFFIKNISDDKQINRIRVKVVCDYGLGVQKIIKNEKIYFSINKLSGYYATDSEGLLDFYFISNPKDKTEKIEIKVKKYIKFEELSNFPKEITIPQEKCW